MNVLQLPNDLLILIFNDMNMDDILPILTVSKQLQVILYERMKEYRAKYNRKMAFYLKHGFGSCNVNFIWNAFHGVKTLEECDFLCEKYEKLYNDKNFLSRVKYTINNTYQVAAETWHLYLQKNS